MRDVLMNLGKEIYSYNNYVWERKILLERLDRCSMIVEFIVQIFLSCAACIWYPKNTGEFHFLFREDMFHTYVYCINMLSEIPHELIVDIHS